MLGAEGARESHSGTMRSSQRQRLFPNLIGFGEDFRQDGSNPLERIVGYVSFES
jgi:hypothetical protein